MWVIGGFLVSCTALLLLSFMLKAWPWMWWPVVIPGVPVKDYVVQSGEFLLCAFGLAHWAIDAWQQNRRRLALALATLALLFLGNIVFVATSRASLVVFAALVGVMAFQRFGWKGARDGGRRRHPGGDSVDVFALFAGADYGRFRGDRPLRNGAGCNVFGLSPRVVEAVPGIHCCRAGPRTRNRRHPRDVPESRGERSESSGGDHRQSAQSNALSIAIQLGLVGVGLLYAMWIAHFLLFRGTGMPAWIGAGLVVQNVVGSLFNSQIFYFTRDGCM